MFIFPLGKDRYMTQWLRLTSRGGGRGCGGEEGSPSGLFECGSSRRSVSLGMSPPEPGSSSRREGQSSLPSPLHNGEADGTV